MKNKGFSLVELIIVIAIMAILIGVMAPQLIKYIEKTNVSSDTQLCDTIHEAIMITLSDPEVIMSNAGEDTQYVSLFSGGLGAGDWKFEADAATIQNCKFAQNVADIVGYNPFVLGSNIKHFKSNPARTTGELRIAVESNGMMYIYIYNSDKSGKKEAKTSIADGAICVPAYN